MSAQQLSVAPAARDDLADIYRYGCSHWGAARTTDYLRYLQEQIWQLLTFPEKGIARDELFPALRSLPVKSHVVFYRLHPEQVEIIRVLSGRQDPHFYLG